MDRELHEMQFMGLSGIYRESLKLIFNLRKILTQITLTLILPLSIIIFAQEYLSDTLQDKILHNEFDLSDTPPGAQRHTLSSRITLELSAYYLIKILYFAFALAFSLLSTSAVVYTVASFYTSREIDYRRIMSVVPKVWKRLALTLLCALSAFVAYCVSFFLVLVWVGDGAGDGLMMGVLAVFVVGFVYMAVVWQTASVASVMEDVKGVKAVVKGWRLVKGKAVVCVVVSVKLIVGLVGINIGYYYYSETGSVWKAVGCVVLLMGLILVGLVVQTVIYMVCKSYHHETVDKSVLADHLEGIYSGKYVPLLAGDRVEIEMGKEGE